MYCVNCDDETIMVGVHEKVCSKCGRPYKSKNLDMILSEKRREDEFRARRLETDYELFPKKR